MYLFSCILNCICEFIFICISPERVLHRLWRQAFVSGAHRPRSPSQIAQQPIATICIAQSIASLYIAYCHTMYWPVYCHSTHCPVYCHTLHCLLPRYVLPNLLPQYTLPSLLPHSSTLLIAQSVAMQCMPYMLAHRCTIFLCSLDNHHK